MKANVGKTKAENVTIVDAGDDYTATDVENALTEVKEITDSNLGSIDTNVTAIGLNTIHSGVTTGNPHNVSLTDVGGTTDHTVLSNIGSSTHVEIDTHLGSDAIHFTQDNISITESQISDLGSYVPTSEKAANNGVATLDAGGKIPANQLPSTVMDFKGNWNATTNIPVLADGAGDAGDVYLCNVGGTQDLGSGSLTYTEGDWVVYNGTIWEQSLNSDKVVSVNSQTGVVILTADDINDDGTSHKFVTSSDLTNLSNLSGTNSGDQVSSDFTHNDLIGLNDGTDYEHITQAQKTALHDAVTVTDSPEIDFTLTVQDLTASIKSSSIDETKLDTSVNSSLDLADSAIQTELDPVFTASEAFNIGSDDITNLSNLSGSNTGDQDLSSYATKANVLELDNIGSYTPSADYHPSTKKYVDDGAFTSPLTTKGDIYTYDTADSKLAVGTDTQLLVADSTTVSGLTWTGKVIMDNDSVVLGVGAGESTPVNKTAIGYQAGATTKTNDTCVGYQAGSGASQSRGVFYGYKAGLSHYGNTALAIGYEAGFSSGGASPLVIGYEAGSGQNGDRVLFLGYQAGKWNTGEDVIALGYQAGLSNSASNKLIIKQTNINATPLIQGDFSTGYVGINKTNAAEALDVNGNIIGTNLSGTNTGDQTDMSSISDTKANFNTACSDGTFLFSGDVTSYTDEEAQDAVGSILVDSSEIGLTYNDTTPSITANIIAASIDETKLDTSVNASLNLADSSLQSETDPVYLASQAASIDAGDITNLGNLSGTNTGDQSSSDFDHLSLQNIGSNNHTQIDTHIANVTSNPHAVDKTDVGLSNVPNTDFTTPVGLNTTHAGLTTGNPHSVSKSDVGLGNVPNTDTTNASNITTGTLPSSVLPPVALTTVTVYASEIAMLAATTEEGDVAVRSDLNKSYMHNSGSAGTMADWTELQTPTDSVLSVNGETGTVVLTTGDIGVDADSNYVTDAQLVVIGNTSNTNTGDQSSGDFTHNSLAGLNDGSDYEHLTATQVSALHAAMTVTDSAEIDFTLTVQDLTASLKSASIDETKLDVSVNASLDLADSAVQTELDPVFTASQAFSIDASDITNLGNLSGTNTGDITVTDTPEIDLTLTGQDISADIKSASIDETKLDVSVNASLDLADSAIQTKYTNEEAQDAVGGMVDSTLTYIDGTPELKVTNPVAPETIGFTIVAGTTPKTLTVALDASVSGTNTGDQSSSDFTHNNLTGLNDGTTYEHLTQTEKTNAATGYAHSQVTTGNPHDVLASEVSLLDTEDNYDSNNVEGALEELGELNSKNGYDLQVEASLPDIAFDNGTRVFTASVKSGSSDFSFWTTGKKISKTTSQTVTIDNTTGTYYIYFDATGTLQAVEQASICCTVFYEYAITGLVYYNATAGTSLVGNELHGYRMSASTHEYNHRTYGARYEGGLDVTGFVAATTTFTGTTSGYFWDEDIRHAVALQATAPFIYKLGTGGEWTGTTPDNLYGFENGTSNVVYNENDGGDWKLTQSGASTDFMIYFMIATPDISGYSVKKIIGQNGYSTRNNARNAIESELNLIVVDGLPSPEFIFLYAYIVKRNQNLEPVDADGNLYLDLRTIKGGTSGTSSSSANIAGDITVDTSSFGNNLSTADTNVQLALDTLDNLSLGIGDMLKSVYDTGNNGIVDNSEKLNSQLPSYYLDRTNMSGTQVATTISDFDTEVANNSAVTANSAKITYPSVDSTKVGFVSVTQAVDLDAIESDTATNNSKVSNATHTGEVTGATSLTVDKTAISGKGLVTASASDYVLVGDTSDSGNLKKALISDFASSGGTVSSVAAGNGLDFSTITGSGSVTLGTPGTTTASTTNAVTTTSHTHALDESAISISASQVSDFDTEVANETSVAANTSARHTILTVTDSSEINFTLTGQDLTGSLIAGSIDETKLDTSTNASLNLADSAVQTELDPVYTASQASNIDAGDITNLSNLSGSNSGDQAAGDFAHNSLTGLNDGSSYEHLSSTEKTQAATGYSHSQVATGNPHSIDKTDVGLGNVANVDTTNASNISSGTLSSSVLPPVALTTVQVAVSQVAMLALTTEEGDVVVRSDENKSYMMNSGSAGDMTDFTELQTPTDSVLSVNGETGTVVITSGDVGQDTDNKFVTDAQLVVIGNTSNTNTGDNATNTLYSGLVSNATHTGDVTGATALTIGADKVKDSMIDWGTSAGQVSTADVPEQTNLYYTEGRVSANTNVSTNSGKISFDSTSSTKLGTIEDGADVTDVTNVTAAGALMDSEVDADIKTLSLPASTTISTFGASLVDDAAAVNARSTLDVDQAGTDNSDNNAVNTLYSGLVSNATHTGDVTGATALTIGADKVLDSHINWGTGATQVNTADIPELTNLYYTDVRVAANSAVALNTAKISFDSTSSTRLANTSGSNTGDQSSGDFTHDSLSGVHQDVNTTATPIFSKLTLNGTDCRLELQDTTGDHFRIQNQNGVFKVINETDSDRVDFTIDGNGKSYFLGDVDFSANIIVDGTVDGVDIAAEETRLQNTSGTNTGDNAGVTSVTGGTSITSSGGTTPSISVTADSITDTQLAFNTGQHLTTSSSPTFDTPVVTGLDITNATTTEDISMTKDATTAYINYNTTTASIDFILP